VRQGHAGIGRASVVALIIGAVLAGLLRRRTAWVAGQDGGVRVFKGLAYAPPLGG